MYFSYSCFINAILFKRKFETIIWSNVCNILWVQSKIIVNTSSCKEREAEQFIVVIATFNSIVYNTKSEWLIAPRYTIISNVLSPSWIISSFIRNLPHLRWFSPIKRKLLEIEEFNIPRLSLKNFYEISLGIVVFMIFFLFFNMDFFLWFICRQ